MKKTHINTLVFSQVEWLAMTHQTLNHRNVVWQKKELGPAFHLSGAGQALTSAVPRRPWQGPLL